MSYTISMAQSYRQHIIVEAEWSKKGHNETAHQIFQEFIANMKEEGWLYLPNLRPFSWVQGWTIPADKVELVDGLFIFSYEVYDTDKKRAQKTLNRIYDYHKIVIKNLKSNHNK